MTYVWGVTDVFMGENEKEAIQEEMLLGALYWLGLQLAVAHRLAPGLIYRFEQIGGDWDGSPIGGYDKHHFAPRYSQHCCYIHTLA